MVPRMTFEQTQRKLAAAARYRDLARYISDAKAQAALVAAAEFERAASAICHFRSRTGGPSAENRALPTNMALKLTADRVAKVGHSREVVIGEALGSVEVGRQDGYQLA